MINPAVLANEATNKVFFHHIEFSMACVMGRQGFRRFSNLMVINIWQRLVIMNVIKNFSCTAEMTKGNQLKISLSSPANP